MYSKKNELRFAISLDLAKTGLKRKLCKLIDFTDKKNVIYERECAMCCILCIYVCVYEFVCVSLCM